MSDNLSPEDRSRTMRAVKSKLTGPERRLRAMLAGKRIGGWLLNCEQIPGKPDVAFPTKKIAVFVDGCFWHGCPICNRPLPVTNREYWRQKISRNIERDRKYDEELSTAGWSVIRIWGHDLKTNSDFAPIAKRIIDEIKDRNHFK